MESKLKRLTVPSLMMILWFTTALVQPVWSTVPLTGVKQKSGRHFKDYKKHIATGNTYMAACHLLDACERKSKAMMFKGKKKFIKKLEPIAKEAFEQKVQQCEGYTVNGKHKAALKGYKHLQSYLRQLRTFASWTLNAFEEPPDEFIAARISNANSSIALTYLKEGAALADTGEHAAAIEKYDQALSYKPGFPDAIKNKAVSHYQLGHNNLKSNHYDKAAEHYLESESLRTGYEDALERGVEIKYQLGKYYQNKGYHRAAYENYQTIESLMPGYKDTSKAAKDSFDAAKTSLSFGKFTNDAYNNVGGIAIGSFLFQELKEKLERQKSQFLVLSFDKQNCDYYLEGAATQVHAHTRGPDRIRKNRVVTWTQYDTYKDSAGKKQTREYQVSRDIVYVEINKSREVALSGYVHLVEANTQKHIFTEHVSSRQTDSARYGELVQWEGPPLRIPTDIQGLLNSRKRVLREEQVMLREVISEIVNTLASQVLAQLDVARRAPDVESLDIDTSRFVGTSY